MKSADIEVGKAYLVDTRWGPSFRGVVVTKDWRPLPGTRWPSERVYPDTKIDGYTIPGHVGQPYTDADKRYKHTRTILVVDDQGKYHNVTGRHFVGDYDTVIAERKAENKRIEEASRKRREEHARYKLDLDTRFKTVFAGVPEEDRPFELQEQPVKWALASGTKTPTHKFMEIAVWAFDKGFAFGEGQEL